jgi:aspartyl-tRNA(Asn)/glutamyl-tRNA(Gln) amidotransferase subunit C
MSQSKLSTDDVKHIVKLAKLDLSQKEITKFQAQLSDVLDYFKILDQVDVDGVEETNQVTGLKNVYRADEIKPSLTQEQALKNSKKTHNGYFLVPAVLQK